jgi:all-trans-retinol 13,14-reductase
MHYFDLAKDVQLSALDTSAYNTVSIAGEEFCFPSGKEAFIEQFSTRFPKERDSIKKYVEIIESIASASSLNSLTSSNRDVAIDSDYFTRSMDSVLDELFEDELLKNVLAGDIPLYAGERRKTPFSQHAFIMDHYNSSAFRIVGGSDSIAKSLAKNIRNAGGEIFANKKVVKIHCDESAATGVETIDGELYEADYVISAIHPNRLLELLDTKLIRPAFRSRITNIPQTISGFVLYVKFKPESMPYMNTNFFGYSHGSPWNCENYTETDWPKGFLYMHMCHQHDAKWAESGVVIAHMNMEDVAQWSGTNIARRGDDYEEFKRTHAERLIAEVEKMKQGFADSIDSYYTSTPLTYQDYTGTEKGSFYGVAKDITLGAAGRVPYRTKVPNLFLAGQNVNSHGFLGVIVGSIVTCSELVDPKQIYKQINEANRYE